MKTAPRKGPSTIAPAVRMPQQPADEAGVVEVQLRRSDEAMARTRAELAGATPKRTAALMA